MPAHARLHRSRPLALAAPSLLRAALAAVLMAAAACADHDPAGLAKARPEPAPAPALAELRCAADVRAGTLGCAPAGPEAAPGVSAAVIGGQDVNVRLASSGTGYDAATGTFRSDVTVENLIPQALGTADGVTPSPDGVRVFFHSGPAVTGGTGTVAVANADGEAVFTGAGQKYFRYDGILAPGDTTPAKEWRFSVPGTVTTFAFTVYVAAAVRHEAGWITLAPAAPALAVGDTQRLAPTVRSVAGRALPGRPVAWATSNAGVAAVDSGGLVTAVAPGTATITATSGPRTGSVEVRVFPPCTFSQPLAVGQAVDGALAGADCQPGDGTFRDQWSLTLAEPAQVHLQMTATGFAPRIVLRGPAGDTVAPAHDLGGTGGTRLAFTLQPGAYTVYATSTAPAAAGAYRLSARNPCRTGESIPLDEKVAAVMDAADGCVRADGSVANLWSFRLESQANVQIEMAGSFSTHLVLYDENGTEVTRAEDGRGASNSFILHALPPGTYTLWATSTSAWLFGGRYTLSVARVRFLCRTMPLELLARRSESSLQYPCVLPDGRSAVVYDLEVKSAAGVRVRLGTQFTPRLAIADTAMRVVASTDAQTPWISWGYKHADLRATLEPGRYYVLVGGREPQPTGGYTMVAMPSCPTVGTIVASPGAEMQGSLGCRGPDGRDYDEWGWSSHSLGTANGFSLMGSSSFSIEGFTFAQADLSLAWGSGASLAFLPGRNAGDFSLFVRSQTPGVKGTYTMRASFW